MMRKRRFAKAASLLLAAAVTMGLTACGGQSTTTETTGCPCIRGNHRDGGIRLWRESNHSCHFYGLGYHDAFKYYQQLYSYDLRPDL